MNTVKLKINPYQELNEISVNEKALSPYSELSNFIRKPFLQWADKFFDTVERELNDDFDLVLCTEPFETLFLNDLREVLASDVNISIEPFVVSATCKERLTELQKLYAGYLPGQFVELQKIKIFDEQGEVAAEHFCPGNLEDAQFVIASCQKQAEQIANDVNAKVILYPSSEAVVLTAHSNYLWGVADMPRVLAAIADRYCIIPAIISGTKALETQYAQMSQADLETYQLLLSIDPILTIGEIPEIEAGHSVQIPYWMIPQSVSLPSVRTVIKDEEIVQCSDGKLTGIFQGTTIIEFYKNDELLPFHKATVRVYQNMLVQRIELHVKDPIMCSGKTQPIECHLFPEDAEDIASLIWSSSDEKVAIVLTDGTIQAKNPGQCTITAKTKRQKTSIMVEVLSPIREIRVMPVAMSAFVGETKEISVEVFPARCYNREYKWMTTDQSVAVVETGNGGKSIVHATGIGSCNLVCKAIEGNAQALCHILVDSTFKKNNEKPSWMKPLLIVFLLLLVAKVLEVPFLPTVILAGIFGVGLIAFRQKKNNWFWILLTWVISAFFYFL